MPRAVPVLLLLVTLVAAAGCTGGQGTRTATGTATATPATAATPASPATPATSAPSATAQADGRPRVMAALGDSITRAFAACGRGGDCVETSWATGTAEGLRSHWQRLSSGGRDVDPGGNHNLAVSGATVTGLAAQVEAALRVRPGYVTVLIGANDACAPDEASMTSVDAFRAAFRPALDALVRGLPEARVLVLSVPDLARLWEVGRDRPDVRRVWDSYGICRSMLAHATDTSADARARRQRVRQRVEAYNAVMASACGRHPAQCRSDGGAVFDYRFDLGDVSDLDYWHPSRRGQETLAEVAWRAGFWA